jgi:hypothetical protein
VLNPSFKRQSVQQWRVLKLADIIYSMNLPYRYGGQTKLEGFDCSGFIVELYRSVGLLKYGTDYSTTGLWEHFKDQRVGDPALGGLVFYGRKGRPTHVALVIDEYHCMAFSGGDDETTNIEDAIARDACAHVNPIDYWDAIVGYVNPFQ